ncbi:MAG: Asp-tRNA(Asn)/Glu-tRNA(Gln) amidotransferase subunit GatC [Candidatus Omnitrophica bacterium]|nr:Asp-tRNA(Asn)/Glu-tRNA(Gln) amidotransferase subunit GatC [Candidatus Omnitrophota bacterium]
MALNKDTVKYTAHLARLELDPEQLEKLSIQLKDILGFIDSLSQLDISNIEPTSHILPINNVLREGVPKESLALEKVLQNAPRKKGNFFSVPKVIE